MPLELAHVYVYPCNWIKPPHDKIGLCICNVQNLVFWFNSEARFHGHGQLACTPHDHPLALTKDCFLDLSGVRQMSEWEVANSGDRGEISLSFRLRIAAALELPIRPLTPNYQGLALRGISPEVPSETAAK